jgi:hypothetical protein
MNAKLNDIWDLIVKLSPKDRKIIYKRMNEDIRIRMNNILDNTNTRVENEEISFEEITNEVESVRGSKYEKN